jgi:hypothetical protein
MKRLETRLKNLESQQSVGELSRSDQMLLVSILARRDALFWPWRWQIGRQPPLAEIVTRQKNYLAGSEGITVKADGAGDWKTKHEQRQKLIASGLVEPIHGAGQILSVLLSAKGEAYARALVGSRLRSFHEVRILLAMLILKSKQSTCKAVRESVLFGIDCVGCPNDWDDYTELMLPLVSIGIVTCHSDTEGRACYTHHIETVPEPIPVAVDVQSDHDFDDHYVRVFDAERALLEKVEPRDPHEVYIPLPATGWGWECHYPQDETHVEK